MKLNYSSLLACAGFAALLHATSTASAQPALGTAENFGVLGATTVTSTGLTIINGDLGVSPGTAVTGFGPGVLSGTIRAGGPVAAQAQADAGLAYTAISALPLTVDLTGQVLGNLGTVPTLSPGVYRFATSAQLNGILTLDFQNNPNAVFVFKIGTTITTASNASVVVINSGLACDGSNVFWQIGSSATLGLGTNFVGTILAFTSITLTNGVALDGRAIALNGAVTMDTNFVSICIAGSDTFPPPSGDKCDDDRGDKDHNGGKGGDDHKGGKGDDDHKGDKDNKGGDDHKGDKDNKGGDNQDDGRKGKKGHG